MLLRKPLRRVKKFEEIFVQLNFKEEIFMRMGD